ncbi:MAG: multicopper oxidase family protein [Polyangiaceae bacterium]|jgi:FtsP/CotA-like multicopper oxidase with cupredoxin domain|nr:multicopper oxidase family protein [Polyangiaceae bacterium]
MTTRRLALALVALLSSCADEEAPPAAPGGDPTTLAVIEDMNPAPDVLEVNLEARASMHTYGSNPPTPVWAYNGAVPGPLLSARVGDRLVARFTNRLPEPTTIHWHGIRLPADMDGSPMVRPPILPGDSYRYEFTLKDPGLYWFHPHVRSDIQVQRGLYGALLVRGPGEPESDDERILMLDDVRLKADGSLAEFLDDRSKMMGREGNTLLINGAVTPTLRFRPGALVRLRLVNTANGRFFHLRLPGLSWRVLGSDGGFFPEPYDAERVLITPGERYDLMVRMPSTAGAIDLLNEPYERGHESAHDPVMKVATFLVEGAPVERELPLPGSFSAPEALAPREPTFSLRFNEEFLPDGELRFTVNGKAHPDVPMTMVERDSIHAFDVINDSDMDHPFHLHGFFFQVLARNGAPEPPARLLNKDTILLPAKQSLRLISRFDEPGMWMYHCHILEHAELGMMGEIHVH